jgi:RNA polymerase sigma-70 factor (ECF subfamily)
MGSGEESEAARRFLPAFDAGHGSVHDAISIAYQEIKRLAVIHMAAEDPGHTLQPTALVNEVYLRLARMRSLDVRDRVHVLSLVSRMMRHILVDHAREKRAQKRGGLRVTLTDALDKQSPGLGSDVIQVSDALDDLEALHPDLVRVVEMRFFAGMTAEEMAAALDRSVPSVNHSLRMAKMWLRRVLASRPETS